MNEKPENIGPRLIDISLPISECLPVWPDSCGVRVIREKALEEGADSNVTRLDSDVHAGTHVEGSLHFFPNGKSIDDIPLDVFIGPAVVAHLPEADRVGADELEQLDLPANTIRLLLRTKNSEMWSSLNKQFNEDYVGVTKDGAEWIVENGIRLVGMDYLSVAKYTDAVETHRILLSDEVTILEGLNLSDAMAGRYELICLPLRLAGAEAAPARVVLRTL